VNIFCYSLLRDKILERSLEILSIKVESVTVCVLIQDVFKRRISYVVIMNIQQAYGSWDSVISIVVRL
jgi:hypothetical protein